MSNRLNQRGSDDPMGIQLAPEPGDVVAGSDDARAVETGASEDEAQGEGQPAQTVSDLDDTILGSDAAGGTEIDAPQEAPQGTGQTAPSTSEPGNDAGDTDTEIPQDEPQGEGQTVPIAPEPEDVIASDRETDAPQKDEPPGANHKIGIDANRPIDPKTGEIQPQVADPDIIASTGTHWVRLNFVLGPWSEPGDDTLHSGRSWAGAYQKIIAGLRDRGLNIYGLIGAEAMPKDPGDAFRKPAPGPEVESRWMDQYVEHFVAIVEMFHEDIPSRRT